MVQLKISTTSKAAAPAATEASVGVTRDAQYAGSSSRGTTAPRPSCDCTHCTLCHGNDLVQCALKSQRCDLEQWRRSRGGAREAIAPPNKNIPGREYLSAPSKF